MQLSSRNKIKVSYLLTWAIVRKEKGCRMANVGNICINCKTDQGALQNSNTGSNILLPSFCF